jgi:hypothetical protein
MAKPVKPSPATSALTFKPVAGNAVRMPKISTP